MLPYWYEGMIWMVGLYFHDFDWLFWVLSSKFWILFVVALTKAEGVPKQTLHYVFCSRIRRDKPRILRDYFFIPFYFGSWGHEPRRRGF